MLRDASTPTPFIKRWWEANSETYTYEELSVAVNNIHTQAIGLSEAMVENIYSRLHAMRLNSEPMCYDQYN